MTSIPLLVSDGLNLHVSKNISPTEPCGATPENACKTIADAVRVAESATESNHTIIIHGAKEQQSCYEVNSTISLANNYHFTSSNGTRACIKAASLGISWAFKTVASVTFKLAKVDFRGIGILIGINRADKCSRNSSLLNVEISDVTISERWWHIIHSSGSLKTFVDVACAVVRINDINIVNQGDFDTKYIPSATPDDLFRFKDTRGEINNLIIKDSLVRGVLFIRNSALVINNVHFVNSTIHDEILKMKDSWASTYVDESHLKVNGLHFRNSNIHKVLTASEGVLPSEKTNVHIENLSSIGNNTVNILVTPLTGTLTLKDVIFNGTIYQNCYNCLSALIYTRSSSSITLKNVLFENVRPNTDTYINYRGIIEAHGDIVLNNVTIRKSKYFVGIKASYSANITARDVYMVGNIGYGHLSLSDNTNVTMSNIYIDNAEYRDNYFEWNSVYLDCSRERMRIKNFNVKLRSGHKACVHFYDDCSQKFQDFANVSCPDQYRPVSKRTGSVFFNECTTCAKKEVNASIKGTTSSIYVTVVTFCEVHGP